jgi:alpha-beta hydrolase superfamily lysophospholipase
VESTGAPDFVSHDSILLSHGAPTPRAFLLLHGLTASPRQFETFGQMLFERGSNVFIPRLPRHGLADRLTTELGRLTSAELQEFAASTALFAASLGTQLEVVGFSVGGLLAAWIGQHVAVARATCIAPFLGVAWLPGVLTGRAARVALGLPNQFWWWDPVQRERLLPVHGYPRFATHAVAHAARLGHELISDARRAAPRAQNLQIVLNASESTVNNRAARQLAAAWARQRPNGIAVHRLEGLPVSHDIIEPLRSLDVVRRVYPALIDLVDR